MSRGPCRTTWRNNSSCRCSRRLCACSGVSTTAGLSPTPPTIPSFSPRRATHYWFQFDAGSGFQNADPLIAGAKIGDTFTTAGAPFSDVPDALRHKVEIVENAEITNPGAALLTGGSGASTTPVLDQTFNTVDLVGRSLSVSQDVSSSGLGAIFSATTNTYTPYIVINQRDGNILNAPQIYGKPFQEVLTNFPFGSQILTGLFLDIKLTDPQADGTVQTSTVEKTLLDRIGFANRQNGTAVSVSGPADGSPALTNLDTWTLEITAATDPISLISAQSNAANDAAAALDAFPDPLVIPTTLDPTSQQAFQASQRLNFEATSLFAGDFIANSDHVAKNFDAIVLTHTYFDSPRIVAVSNTLESVSGDQSQNVLAFDILRDTPRSLAMPGQAQIVTQIARYVHGMSDSVLEQDELTPATPTPGTTTIGSLDTYEQALAQPGVQPVVISSDNLATLASYNFPAEAAARITQAAQAGKAVLVPSQTVLINGVPRLAWIEVNPATGDAIAVSDNGMHMLADDITVKEIPGSIVRRVSFGKGNLQKVIQEARDLANQRLTGAAVCR